MRVANVEKGGDVGHENYAGTSSQQNALSGFGEAIAVELRQRKQLCVSHMGVRFRSRSCDELIEQIEAFGSRVAPHLNV